MENNRNVAIYNYRQMYGRIIALLDVSYFPALENPNLATFDQAELKINMNESVQLGLFHGFSCLMRNKALLN